MTLHFPGPDELAAIAEDLLNRTKTQRCIRCGADGSKHGDEPGCSSHDWPWEHGYAEAPAWFAAWDAEETKRFLGEIRARARAVSRQESMIGQSQLRTLIADVFYLLDLAEERGKK